MQFFWRVEEFLGVQRCSLIFFEVIQSPPLLVTRSNIRTRPMPKLHRALSLLVFEWFPEIDGVGFEGDRAVWQLADVTQEYAVKTMQELVADLLASPSAAPLPEMVSGCLLPAQR